MSNDDDIIIRHKAIAAVKALATKPVPLKLWHVLAIALTAFALGAWTS